MGILEIRSAGTLTLAMWLGLALTAFVLVSPTVAQAKRAKTHRVALVIVVGKDSKLEEISLGQLKSRYDGNDSSRSLIPFNMPPGSSERLAFDKAVLGLSKAQVGRYWIDRKIRGQSSAPRSLTGTSQLAKVVARFPGALGYMRADQLPSWLRPLKVSGKHHDDTDYPLFVEVEK